MKIFLMGFLKSLFKTITALIVIFIIYGFFLIRDIKKVDNFCSEMKPGLDVNQIHLIADKYGVGFSHVRDPNSVKNQKLGIKLTDKENTWFFAVGAPMTIGEHACGVYHDNHVVLSAKARG